MLTAKLVLNQFFKIKREGRIVRVRARALRQEETNAIRWAQVAQAQRCNKTIIRSLWDRDGRLLHETKQICA